MRSTRDITSAAHPDRYNVLRRAIPLVSHVQNVDELLSNGSTSLRRVAIEIANRAIDAADPGKILRELLAFDGASLTVGQKKFELKAQNRIFVIGAGKASYPIAKALDEIIGERIHRGFVTCKQGQAGSLKHIELHHASHPIPDAASHLAATRTRELLDDVRAGDLVIACFTGGSSALFVDPVSSISLEDKMETNRLLLGSGANIIEINAVRKHLSRVKGGKLIQRLPAKSRLINLTVSDVIGDHLDYITDPTVADTSTFADAKATLEKYQLWDALPRSVSAYLRESPLEDETPREAALVHIERFDFLLVKNDAACRAAADAAQAMGYTPLILSTLFEGESRELARFMAAIAKQALHDGSPLKPPCVLIGGGECTVRAMTGTGTGGPNQEFAVSFALEVAGLENIAALSIDTDGTDGPTQIAGGLVDGTTALQARRSGVNLYAHLSRHDVTPALHKLGAAVVTGATGTNVNDLRLIIIRTP